MSKKRTKRNIFLFNKRYFFYALFFLIVAFFVAGFVFYNNKGGSLIAEKKYGVSTNTDCSGLLNAVDKAILANDTKNAKLLLSSNSTICKEEESKKLQLNFFARNAAAQYLTGDKKAAKDSAADAIELDKKMPEFEKQTPNYESMIIDMQDIKNNQYEGDGVFY